MYIKIVGMYHMDKSDPRYSSYWKKSGDYGFEFTPNKDNASNLTEAEVEDILRYKKHYCNMYGASNMLVES